MKELFRRRRELFGRKRRQFKGYRYAPATLAHITQCIVSNKLRSSFGTRAHGRLLEHLGLSGVYSLFLPMCR